MKKFLFIPVLLAVLFQTSARLAVLINFKLNQQYIAQNLCVKKEIKNNNCKGHCCLKKELEKQEKSEAPVQSLLKEKSGVYFCSSFQAASFNLVSSEVNHYTPLLIPVPVAFSQSLFHPPNNIC